VKPDDLLQDPPAFRNPDTLVRNVHGQIAERIGLGIVSGDFPPGEPLPSEVRICEMMGVSRPVVREAIRSLTGKGLLESRPKSGTRVRAPELWNHLDPDVLRWRLAVTETDTYLAKIFQLREALDPTASALAALAANDADRRAIRRACDGMASARDNDEFVTADIAFHKSIYLATHNEFFWPIAQMFDFTLRQSFAIAATGDHRARALKEHRDLMEAIVSRDPLRARAATDILVGHSARDLVVIMGRDPF
jgi:DNA-binding FadR family transcriptional regulator